MSRRKQKKDAAPGPLARAARVLVPDLVQRRVDSIVNAITALGTSRDPRNYTQFHFRRFQAEELAEVYAASHVGSRLCDLYAEDMARKWWSFTAEHPDAQAASDVTAYVLGREDEIDARGVFRLAETWAESQGGGIVVMGLDDGAARLSQPVRDGKHRLLWLRAFERVDVHIEAWDTDPKSPRYMQPSMYRLWRRAGIGVGGDTLVHGSRVLHFPGLTTPALYRDENSGWDTSLLQRCFDVIRDLSAAHAGIGRLQAEFGIPVLKLDGQTEMVAGDNSGLIVETIALMMMGKSLANAYVIDKEDEVTRDSPSVAGLADLLDRSMELACLAGGVPVTVFAGRSPGGLNSTGTSDHALWANRVSAKQYANHGFLVERLRRVLMREPGCPVHIESLKTWESEPNPLYEPTAQEKAATDYQKAQTIQVLTTSLGTSPALLSRDEGRAYVEAEGLAVLKDEEPVSSALVSALAKLSQRALPPKAEPAATVATPAPEVLPPEQAASAPTINELSLAVERFGRLGDVSMVNTLRAALAKQFGLPPPDPITAEEMAAVRARVTGAEAGAEAQAQAGTKGDARRRDQEPFDSILAGFSDEMLLDLLADVLESEGRRLGEAEIKRLGVSTGFNVQNPYYVKALEEFKLRHLPEINATTRDALEIIFAEYSEAGLGRDALVRRMRDVYGEFTQTRAEGIARTEMTMVQSAANYAAWDETEEIEEVEWSARMVNTRPSHASMHGQRRKHGEPFEAPSGAKALHPGGFGDAAEDINCQCVLVPVTVLSDRADSAARADARRRDAQAEQDIARLREEAIERFTRLTYAALMEQFDKAVRK